MPNNNAVRKLANGPVFRAASGLTTVRDTDPRGPLLRLEQFRDHYDLDARTVRAEEQEWQVPIFDTLVRYALMQEGWDSYSGQPLRWDVGMFALTVLSSVMRPRTPPPQIVPVSDGAVQIEWHQKQIDLELYISAPYVCEVFFHDRRTGTEFSEELSNDFTRLTSPIAELTTR
jgi:hypothetical protein